MTHFKILTNIETQKFFHQDVGEVQKLNEPVFRLSGSVSAPKNDPLLEVEISLRKCERVGVFEESR